MDITNFFFIKLPVTCTLVPCIQAFTTAGSGGMLGNKYRMTAKRGLAAFIRHSSRCQPGADKIKRMVADDSKASIGYIGTLMM